MVMQINKYSKLATEDVFGTMEELTSSGMNIDFGSFESKREVGKRVFFCKIKSWSEHGGFQEHAKGYGDTLIDAFNKTYNNLNAGRDY